MNRIYVLPEDELRGQLYRRIYLLIRRSLWTRQSIGASLGLAGGLLSIIMGTLLWAIVAFLAPVVFGALLNAAEITFFALSLPLLALGAYCLDLLEKNSPRLPLPPESHPAVREPWPRLRPRQPDRN